MMFELGQAVWVYEPTIRPFEGVVSELLDYGAIRVQTREKLYPNSVYTAHRVFARPQERDRLISVMEDDAYDLTRYADELREALSDGDAT